MDNFRDVFYNELNDEIIFAVQYGFNDPQISQGFSAEFTSTVRQGRQDGLNLANPNLVTDLTVYGGTRTAVSYVTFGEKNEITKFLPEGTDVTVFPPTYGGAPGREWSPPRRPLRVRGSG